VLAAVALLLLAGVFLQFPTGAPIKGATAVAADNTGGLVLLAGDKLLQHDRAGNAGESFDLATLGVKELIAPLAFTADGAVLAIGFSPWKRPFLRRLMPRKPLAEIYTVLGRARQGKTERYRSLFSHLEDSSDLFVHASGVKGMVMEVFTLPSFDVVFKVIRDRFEYPKTSSREEVMQKYDLVFKRDRAGRLVDAQEFRRLRFPEARFDPDLLMSLLEHCAETCRVEDGDVVVEHAYIERRLVPLGLRFGSDG